MNREIKFRAWTGTEYLEFSLNPFGGIDPIVDWDRSQKDTDNDNGCVGVTFIEGIENLVWEQYTGLKDKNGVDIYEGDIVSFTIPGITHGPDREDYTDALIWFDEEDGVWTFGRYTHPHCDEPFDWGFTISGDRIDVKSFEILGNIHQNKDLLA